VSLKNKFSMSMTKNPIENLDRLDPNEDLIKINESFENTQKDGVNNILRYFDRIHDKLFNFNNILIVGYFALSKIYNSIPAINILIPICNLILLLYIEYRMMEKSRFESKIMEQSSETIDGYGKKIDNTTLFSLLSILSTLFVTGMFLYYVFR
jgi:hypothetical protein